MIRIKILNLWNHFFVKPTILDMCLRDTLAHRFRQMCIIQVTWILKTYETGTLIYKKLLNISFKALLG
jgi:hypothetical protein